MPIERRFLDWSRPCLPAAAERLLAGSADGREADLGGIAVVVPGARAGRRLVELLVERAEGRGLRLVPPRVVTAGRLDDILLDADLPAAGEIARRAAWAAAMRGPSAHGPGGILPACPEPGRGTGMGDGLDFAGWMSLGALLDRLHVEVAGEGHTFADVAVLGEKMPDFTDGDRWRSLEMVRAEYLRRLAAAGLHDPGAQRIEALAKGGIQSRFEIRVVACAELNRIQKKMLAAAAESVRVEAWIHAPEALADRFDETGCVLPKAWLDARIELPLDRVDLEDGPADQAGAALRAVAAQGTCPGEARNREAGRARSPAEITIGVPDPEVVAPLEDRFLAAGIPARPADGRPAARTAPALLLDAAARWIAGRGADAFAALVRHPDVEARLHPDLTALDGWRRRRAPGRIDGSWPAEVPAHPGEAAEDRSVRRLHDAVAELTAGLDGPPRPPGEWAAPILDLLVRVHGSAPLDRRRPSDRTVVEVGDLVLETLEAFRDLPSAWTLPVDAAGAVRLVLQALEGARIPPPPEEEAVDLLGWLELPLDDAPVLVVTGFNEGRVPGSLNGDAFLPDALRRRLGLLDNDRRYARDAYALSAILASRPEARFTSGRRSDAGDPLMPSRLLFAGDPAEAPGRVQAFFRTRGSEAAKSKIEIRKSNSAKGGSGFVIPKPPDGPPAGSRVMNALRVTAFKDYLACPYRFWLRHVRGLEALDDDVPEMDAAAFGTLAHDVLEAFGRDPVAAATDARTIRRWIEDRLSATARGRFGREPAPAVWVQVEQLRERLAAFATWQAGHAALGWRIRHVELTIDEGEVAFPADGPPFFLKGRIDRIDVHEKTGEALILDYKTSEKGAGPESEHRSRKRRWKDLQLPLYRHLASARGIRNPGLGYVVLPQNPSATGLQPADWSADDLDAADAAAREVIAKIRAGAFWPPAETPPPFSEAYDAVCQVDQRVGRPEEDEEEKDGEGTA